MKSQVHPIFAAALESFQAAFAPTKPQDVRSLAELHLGKPIVTSHVFPPIPVRTMDWSAVTDDYEGGHPIGWGATEQDAIADLVEQIEELRVIESRNELMRGGPTVGVHPGGRECPGTTTATLGADSQRHASVQRSSVIGETPQ